MFGASGFADLHSYYGPTEERISLPAPRLDVKINDHKHGQNSVYGVRVRHPKGMFFDSFVLLLGDYSKEIKIILRLGERGLSFTVIRHLCLFCLPAIDLLHLEHGPTMAGDQSSR